MSTNPEITEPVNPAVILSELVQVEASLAVLGKRKTRLRAALEDEARKQYQRGVIPSWKSRGVGSATLSGAGTYEPVILDPDDWAHWVATNHPGQAEAVVRIPTQRMDDDALELVLSLSAFGAVVTTEVRPGMLDALAKETAEPNGDACPIVTADGEKVPGVELRRRDGHLHVVLDRGAKARAMAALEGLNPEEDE